MVQSILKCTRYSLISLQPRSLLKMYVARFSSNDESSDDSDIEIPEAPTNCCMAGCANCVWVAYAEKLMTIFKDGGERARKEILEKVEDENMRSFLMMELRNLKSKQ